MLILFYNKNKRALKKQKKTKKTLHYRTQMQYNLMIIMLIFCSCLLVLFIESNATLFNLMFTHIIIQQIIKIVTKSYV